MSYKFLIGCNLENG